MKPQAPVDLLLLNASHLPSSRVSRVHGFVPDGIDQLALRFLLFQSDIRIQPEYRKLLFG